MNREGSGRHFSEPGRGSTLIALSGNEDFVGPIFSLASFVQAQTAEILKRARRNAEIDPPKELNIPSLIKDVTIKSKGNLDNCNPKHKRNLSPHNFLFLALPDVYVMLT